MRILWFCNTPAAGDEFISSNGTGGWLKSLDKAIQDKIELHVAFYDRRYPAEFKVGKTTYHQIAPYDKKSLILRRVKLFLKKNNPDISRSLDLIDKVKPDIIHIHGTERQWIELVPFTDIPIILSIQAILTVMNYKYFSGIERDYVNYYSYYNKRYKEFLYRGEIERKNIKRVNYVMGRTDWDRRVYSVLAPHAHYFKGGEILRDGFYQSSWRKHERNDDKIIIHTTTGSMLFKGLETICMAISSLNKAGYNVEWRVAGVAENSDFVKLIKKKLKGDYPEKGLLLLGSLDEKKLIESMLEADIYVAPSHQDNSPNALCEATMLGMPCICTCAGGSSTILQDGITGIVIQDGDPWVMAGAIIELYKDNGLVDKYSKNAKQEADKRHNRDVVVNQTLEAYKIILNNQ